MTKQNSASRSAADLEAIKSPRPGIQNVFEAILKYGHDEDFAPVTGDDFAGTQAPAGSRKKLDVMAERIRRGEPGRCPRCAAGTPPRTSGPAGN